MERCKKLHSVSVAFKQAVTYHPEHCAIEKLVTFINLLQQDEN